MHKYGQVKKKTTGKLEIQVTNLQNQNMKIF